MAESLGIIKDLYVVESPVRDCLALNDTSQVDRRQYPASSIQYPASSIQHPVSSLSQHRLYPFRQIYFIRITLG